MRCMLLPGGTRDCSGVGADLSGFNFSRASKDLLDLQERKGPQATRQVSYHSLFICLSSRTHRHFIFSLSVSSPPLIPIPNFSVPANSNMVRDVKDLARVLGGMRKGKVRPLESQRGPWISQGECSTQPGLGFGREKRRARMGLGQGQM